MFSLSFLDIEKLAGHTLSVCEQAGLPIEKLDELQMAYGKLRLDHLPYRIEVRDGVIAAFSRLDGGQQVLNGFQNETAQRELERNFPTDKAIATKGYCSAFFPEILKGKRVAINFGDYAAQLREYGTFKILLPKNR